MMTPEESAIVKIVYERFLSSEKLNWDEIDDNLELVGFMSDKELVVECTIKFMDHSFGRFRCAKEHIDGDICFAPLILEAVGSVIKLYDTTQSLHERNKYVLSYYLVMSELRLIYAEQGSSAV